MTDLLGNKGQREIAKMRNSEDEAVYQYKRSKLNCDRRAIELRATDTDRQTDRQS